MPEQSQSFSQQFQALSSCLSRYQRYWRCQPFKQTPRWAIDEPELTKRISCLTEASVTRAQASDDAMLEVMTPLLPDLGQHIETICRLDYLGDAETDPGPPDIPGRKWKQIEQFSHAIGHTALPVVEWCAGKAHLGRHVAQRFQVPVVSLEQQMLLVEQGHQLSVKAGLALELRQCDVLQDDTSSVLRERKHLLALHACGGLHRKLLQVGAEQRSQRLSWSPCCYHKYLDGEFSALSHSGRASGLSFATTEIRGAVRQNSTAGNAERERHKRLQAWRLGFDLLQRNLRGCDSYLPTPPVPAFILKGEFREFCEYLADRKVLTLASKIDYDFYERAGCKRYAEISRQELLRELFRRPLELWIVLDEILFLEEQGYHCRLGTFCDATVTPRNLFIDAKRHLSAT